MTLRSLVGRAARFVRARRAGWSAETDRAFHDEIFATQRHDPFDPSYPGSVTIRRFADLASSYVSRETEVHDLGCGPGEITCELARRFPAIRFRGLDHSGAAIERARQLAESAGLSNVSFDRVDVSTARVDDSAGLVAMFDAFHHMPDPGAFLARNAHVPRWFLIEPAGDALGRWKYRHDLDWVPVELDKLRWRVEHELGEPVATSTAGDGATVSAHDTDAVEYRYSLDDYEGLFHGYGMDVVGTTAGLNSYPPGPSASSEWRRSFNDFAYRVISDADARLLATGDDLDARHWAIYFGRGEAFPRRRPKGGDAVAASAPLQGAYGATYSIVRAPEEIPAGATANVVVSVTNSGFLDWRSDGAQPFNMSYHWRDGRGAVVVLDGQRTPLSAPVTSGQSATTNVVVIAPPTPGRYTLEIELVHEGVTWLSQAGQPTLALSMRVD